MQTSKNSFATAWPAFRYDYGPAGHQALKDKGSHAFTRIDNELVPLDQVMQQRQNERSIPLKDDDAFELFACEQVLRDRDLSAEEVALGVVGGGNDGAIDGVYVFLGDALLSEDSEVLQDGAAAPRPRRASPSRQASRLT